MLLLDYSFCSFPCSLLERFFLQNLNWQVVKRLLPKHQAQQLEPHENNVVLMFDNPLVANHISLVTHKFSFRVSVPVQERKKCTADETWEGSSSY